MSFKMINYSHSLQKIQSKNTLKVKNALFVLKSLKKVSIIECEVKKSIHIFFRTSYCQNGLFLCVSQEVY